MTKVLDLFAGVGGIRLGMEYAGFETVFANDFEKKCSATYDLNHSAPKLDNRNLQEIDPESLPDHDILTGGFPCQPFSRAGLQKGFADRRGVLFFTIADILQVKKPKAFLLENVKGLVNHDGGRTLSTILEICNNLGYHTQFRVLNTKKHGNVPQNRERVFLVGFRDRDSYAAFQYPEEIPLDCTFWDFLEDKVDDKYYINDTPLYDKVKYDIVDPAHSYQWRYGYVRQHKHGGVVPTLVTGGTNPLIIVDDGIRYLTPKETFNLQGFPVNFQMPDISDNALYKQSGNSVSVPVIARLAEQMKLVM